MAPRAPMSLPERPTPLEPRPRSPFASPHNSSPPPPGPLDSSPDSPLFTPPRPPSPAKPAAAAAGPATSAAARTSTPLTPLVSSMASPGAPPPATDREGRMAPPYRHGTRELREAAVGAVAAAEAELAAAAEEAGLRHPASDEEMLACQTERRTAWLHLRSCCRRLAWTLSGPELFDSELFHTREGAFRMRRMMEDLRFVGTAELVNLVLKSWRFHILRAPDAFDLTDDAVHFAKHVWGMIKIVSGFSTFLPYSLLPVDRDLMFSMLGKVDRVLAGHASPDPRKGDVLLYVGSTCVRARVLEQFRDTDAALALYFDAWTVLIRAGLSPSRMEASLLRELVEALLRVPHKLDLASQLCESLYWFWETEEDKYQRALCLHTLATERSMRGRHAEARKLLLRAAALIADLSPSFRAHEGALHAALLESAVLLADPAGAREYVARAVAAFPDMYPPSSSEMDLAFASATRAKSFHEAQFTPPGWTALPSLHDSLDLMRRVIQSLGHLEPKARLAAVFAEGHAQFQLGMGEMSAGDYRRALEALERASALLYRRYSAYFPPHLPRVRHLERALAECRARLNIASGSPRPSPYSSRSSSPGFPSSPAKPSTPAAARVRRRAPSPPRGDVPSPLPAAGAAPLPPAAASKGESCRVTVFGLLSWMIGWLSDAEVACCAKRCST